jgi:hypothetical protein
MMGFDGYKFVSTEPGKLGAKPGKLTSTGGLPMGNGAESRKTFHFFPPGYGALVGSPTTTEIRPMFIDTKNRAEFGKPLDPSVPTRHGPVPENSNIPPSEMYSGMMECPCTDRYLKQFSTASTQQSGTCFELIGRSKQKKSTVMTSAAQCFEGATSLGTPRIVSWLTMKRDAIHDVHMHTPRAVRCCRYDASHGQQDGRRHDHTSGLLRHRCGRRI